MILFVNFTTSEVAATQSDELKQGPYVDTIIYQVISSGSQQATALLNDDVDLLANTADPAYIDTFEADPDIEIAEHLRNGYGKFIINCDKYPFNITTFRRAFAFALDKNNVSNIVFEGDAIPIDSPLPVVNPWSIEGDLSYSYYDQNIAKANQILDAAGFADIDVDIWREAPDGSDFSVDIEFLSASSISAEICAVAEDSLQAIGVNASSIPRSSFDFISRVDNHGDFDVVFLAKNFAGSDPTWLVTQFGSDYYHVAFANPSNWNNISLDFTLNLLLTSPTYSEVLWAITEAQEIITYHCPEIPIYSNVYYTAYRNDRFEGHVADQEKGINNIWTNLQTHLKVSEGGPNGGTLREAIPEDIDSFNFMVSNSIATRTVLDNLYMTLFKHGPTGEVIPYLAESFIVETHADNSSIPEGHTRYTIDIIQNATWSDFTPLTANDAQFTFDFYKNSTAFGNPMGYDMDELVTAYASSTYQVVLEFSTESYWHFDKFAYDYILPEYAFTQAYIGPPAWALWDPVFTTDPHVTCGPFILSDYQSGEYIELTANPFYPYQSPLPPTVSGPDDFEAPENYLVEITWTASDDNPVVYFVLENGTQMVGESWFGEDITYAFNAPSPGWVFNLTVVVWDADAQYAIDTVLVTGVMDTLAPEFIIEPSDFEFSLGNNATTMYWEFYDGNLASLRLYLDDAVIYEDLMFETPTSLEWDVFGIDMGAEGLDVGVHNYTLYLDDIWMNVATSTAFVTVVDESPPSIDHPMIVVLLAGEATNNVTWTAIDSDPASYSVYLNGTVIETGSWTSGVPIVVDLSSLEFGIYNATIVVSDVLGNEISDTVMVFVLPSTTPIQNMVDTIMLISIGIVGVGVVVIVILVKLKRPS